MSVGTRHHDPTPIRGRQNELDLLENRMLRAVAGTGQVVLIEGEAGIGKSRLLEELHVRAATAGAAFHLGRARELERHRPFGPLADALDVRREADDRAVARVAAMLYGETTTGMPAIAYGTSPHAHFAVVEAMVDLVESVAGRGPMVLVLDDMHWADEATVLTAGRIVRSLPDLPVLLVCALRPTPRSPHLDALLDELAGAERIHVGPLDADSTRTLAGDIAGDLLDERLEHALAGAGGNPLFVIELARSSLGPTGPHSLHETVAERLRGLSEPAADAVRVASVLGSTFAVTDLGAVLDRSTVDLLGSVRELMGTGILDEDGDRLAFRHDLVREAVYLSLPASMRKSLHAHAARALADTGASADRVAEHHLVGAVKGDTEAVSWLRRAAGGSALTAPVVALDLLERALELCPVDGKLRTEVCADRCLSLLWAGRVEEAEAEARQALTGAIGHDDLEATIRVRLAMVLENRGRAQEAIEQMDLATPSLPERDRVRVRAEVCVAKLQTFAFGEVAEEAPAILGAAERLDDDFAVVTASRALATAVMVQGDLERAISLASHSVARANRSDDLEVKLRGGHAALAMALLAADRLEEAEDVLARARKNAEEQSIPWNLQLNLSLIAGRRYHHGRWDDSIAEAETAVEIAEETGIHTATVTALGVMALIALRRGDNSTADALLEQAAAIADDPESNSVGSEWLASARMLRLEIAGDLEGGRRAFEGLWNQVIAVGARHLDGRYGVEVIRRAVAAGDIESAAEAFERVRSAAGMMGTPTLRAAADTCRGLIEGDPSGPDAAIETYRSLGLELERAAACEDAAGLYIANGDRERGAERLSEAMAAYEGLEASWDVARVSAALRAAGVTRGVRGPRKRPTAGWDALTPTERQVVALVQQGLTNPAVGERLFISKRTVATHLSHVYQKVGVRTRVELAAAAAAANLSTS